MCSRRGSERGRALRHSTCRDGHVNDFDPDLRSWREIRAWFENLELTPLPSQGEIEAACSPAGLGLPTVKINSIQYIDVRYLSESQDERSSRTEDYAAVPLRGP